MEHEAPSRRMVPSCRAGLHLPSGPSRLHFYPTMLATRIGCISLKIKVGDTFYPTINRGVSEAVSAVRTGFEWPPFGYDGAGKFSAISHSTRRLN